MSYQVVGNTSEQSPSERVKNRLASAFIYGVLPFAIYYTAQKLRRAGRGR